MTDKAYIVANEQQEMTILRNLAEQGYAWRLGVKPTGIDTFGNKYIVIFAKNSKRLTYMYGIDEKYLSSFEIVYDGRKEE